MTTSVADILRIEGKLDLILDALGLTDNHRLAPCEIQDMAKRFVQQHREKRKAGSRDRKEDSGGRL
jgi:hypothetical protein